MVYLLKGMAAKGWIMPWLQSIALHKGIVFALHITDNTHDNNSYGSM